MENEDQPEPVIVTGPDGTEYTGHIAQDMGGDEVEVYLDRPPLGWDDHYAWTPRHAVRPAK